MKTFAASKGPSRTPSKPVTTASPQPKPTPALGGRGHVKPKVSSSGRTGVPRGRNPNSPRPGSKARRVLALLRRPQGASLKTLLKITGWQPHSIRGFLSGTVAKKMGLKVRSIKTELGERRYEVRP